MFGNLGELAGMMKKAKEIQGNLGKFKEELPSLEFSAGAGRVSVTVGGDFTLRRISISGEAPADGKLEQEIIEAVNLAVLLARGEVQKKMNEVTGGIKLPEIFG